MVDHRDGLSDDDPRYILTGKDSQGSALLLKDILSPYLTVTSMSITKNPKHLITAEDVDVMSAPFRIVFLAHALDLWESSSMERMDQLTIEMRHTALHE